VEGLRHGGGRGGEEFDANGTTCRVLRELFRKTAIDLPQGGIRLASYPMPRCQALADLGRR
jgi:hypothetical protein